MKKKLKNLKRGIKGIPKKAIKPVTFLLSHVDEVTINPVTKEVTVKFKKEF